MLARAAAALLVLALLPPAPAGAADPAAPADLLPGVPLDGLTEAQRQVVAQVAGDFFCPCGCPHALTQCLKEHRTCEHAQRAARLAARVVTQLPDGPSLARDLERALADYYAGFDARKRATLEVAGFGPPLGDPAAPVTIVEFSDFTCPFCQLFRPVLEKFVEDRPGRVQLISKPFPLERHEHSLEASQAAEWARERGAYWKMHEVLFANANALAPADLVSYARDLGLPADDLREALESGRYRERLAASQAEARAAGLRGTPTLYFNGRRLALPDLSEWSLEFMLQDEEEWARHRGWAPDAGDR
jgi:protein-disulfide isomerase